MHASSSVSIDFDALNTDSLYALSNSNLSIVFRFLRDGDQNEVKTLCHDCFPIEYPDTWYNDIVQSKEYFALAACNVNTEKIIALIVAKVFPLGSCNHYEQKILHKTFSLTTSVCYILILGVTKEYRRQGLATRLLQNLLNMLYKYETCKAVYLHVLYSNKQAIKFYQSNLFQYRLHLPYYYFIKDEHLDAYCFVRYTNGGYPPFSLSDFLSNIWTYLMQVNPCHLLNAMRIFLTSKLMYINSYQRISYQQTSHTT